MPPKILVVDDDEKIRSVVKRFMTGLSYSVVTTDNGSEALLLVRESEPDIVLMDVEMPGLDGFALCRVLRKEAEGRSIPIIMMSGTMIEEQSVLKGFEGGADDYIAKPFSLPVLAARIAAVLKRYETTSQMGQMLKKSGIALDPAGRTVRVKGKPVSLTRKEFDLLATLISKPGHLLSVRYLLETVWGYDPADYNDPGTVEVHISHLRKKIGPKAAKLIVSVTGHGYKFEEHPS